MAGTAVGETATETEAGRSASDRAYERLAHLIETCQLPPGWHFGNEEEEAAKLGMSRTPFREALQRLEQEGLVMRFPKQRTVVTKIDTREFEHHMVVRRAIELEILRDALAGGAELPIARAESILEQQAKAAEAGDLRAFLRLDPEFHLEMVGWSGNRAALAAAGTAWRHLNRARYLGTPPADYVASTLAEHRGIVEALRRRDARALEKAIRHHTGAAMRRRLQQMRDSYPEAFIQR